MRISVVSPYYAPDFGPSAPLMTMLCEDLVALGNDVTVFAAVPHFPTGWVAPENRRQGWSWETRNGVRVCRVWIPSGKRADLRHRALTFITYQVMASVPALRSAPDAVLITNPAIETWLPFTLLSWLRRKPCLFCVWDLYPEVGVQLGVFRWRVVADVVRSMEDFCLRHANAVHVLTPSFVSSLRMRGIKEGKLAVILPWLDMEFIRPLPRQNAFAREHGLDDCFVVLYAGNLGYSQGLEDVLLAAKALSATARIHFAFVGDGPNRDRLAARADELCLDCVHFIPFQPRERLPEVLATADISLVSLKRGIGAGSLPSKTFPILASGRPIVASVDKGSDIANLLHKSAASVCVLPGDVDGLVSAILALERDPDRRATMGLHGREYALRHHSRLTAAQSFDGLLRRVMHGGWGTHD